MANDNKALREPLFRIINSAPANPDQFERRLEYLGKPLSDATDIEITLDQLVWIKSGSPQCRDYKCRAYKEV